MIEIKNELQTVEMLFGETPNVQYRIPIYQRRYVWDILNWESLWTDIENTYETKKPIFTGIIVTRQHANQGDLAIYDVIDGQQRLTTFQIILCVIYRKIHSKRWADPSEIIARARDLITNEDQLVEEVGEKVENKLCPKTESADEDVFCVLVDSSAKIPPKQDDEHIIYSAYRYFESQIQDYDYNRMVELYNNITLGINVAQINMVSLEDNDEGDVTPEKVFASLNATGRMLSEFDYLRNDLFLRAEENGERYYKSETHWHPSFEDDDASDLDTFLNDFLKANLGPSRFQSNKKPFELYQQDYRSLLTPTVEDEFRQLSAYAQFNKEMNDPSSEIGKHIQFYADLCIPPLDSFILFLKHRSGLPDTELPKVYTMLESYIIRGMLCNDGHDYERINKFFSEVSSGTCKFTIHEFTNFLSDTWPDYDPVMEALEQLSLQGNRDLIRYILYRIELLKGNPASLSSFTDVSVLKQIVLPEVLVADLPYDSNLESSVSEAYAVTDSIGNIAALTSDPLLDWSALSFDMKKDVLQKQVTPGLTLTKRVCESTNWGVPEIRETTEELYSAFSEIWPPPQQILKHALVEL